MPTIFPGIEKQKNDVQSLNRFQRQDRVHKSKTPETSVRINYVTDLIENHSIPLEESHSNTDIVKLFKSKIETRSLGCQTNDCYDDNACELTYLFVLHSTKVIHVRQQYKRI